MSADAGTIHAGSAAAVPWVAGTQPEVAAALPAAAQVIHESERIALICHVNPDGDTLGSVLALGLSLEAWLHKQVTLLSADGVPTLLSFLPGIENVHTTTTRADFDLAIVVDAGDLSRIGDNRRIAEAAPRLMDIDHHVTAGVFGDWRLLDSSAAATGEIVYDLLHQLGAPLTAPVAQCLLCALLTDTGSFRFMNVTPRTMEIAAILIRHGGTPNEIAEQVFENKSFAGQKMLGRALESMRQSRDGRIVWAVLTQQDFRDFNGTDEETEGIVNHVRAVRGAEVALFLREMASGKLRVSLRARDPFDVSQIAAEFGGGGHRLASGCTLDGPIEQAIVRLLAAVERRLSPPLSVPPIE